MANEKIIPADQPGLEPADDRWHRIVEGASKVFWKLGIKSVTMDDVATRLGISKKTLYQYVTDKNDLVDKILKHVSTCYKCDIDAVRAREKQNAIDELYAVTTTVAGHIQDIHPSIHFDLEKYHPEAFSNMVANKRKEILECMTENMTRGIAEGLYREDLNIPMIATIYIARFDMVFDGHLFPPERFSFSDLHWEIFRYHVRGIASKKGLEYLEKKMIKERVNVPPAPGVVANKA
ncbi:MAG: TetR/AcrR family transcriptional regulator [Flavobacteriales bacterium]|nr:TetR/AcrR family transcriptional regulator [Flavobacteriales bacterium]